MGRRPTKPGAVPHLRLRKRGKVTYYYYDQGGTPRKEIALGTSYPDAIRKWSELECAQEPGKVITFKDAADKYRREVIPTKRPSTQRVNLRELTKLIEYFDDPPAPLASIRPVHIGEYMDWRTDKGKRATHSATRERALLSHLWNKCRRWGFTDLPNPCRGIEGAGKAQRGVYVEDKLLAKVYKEACQPLRDAIDLAYLTGQRPADMLALEPPREGFLHFQQAKTEAKRRMKVQGELKAVLARIARRKKKLGITTIRLVVDDTGRGLTKDQLRYRFDKAREDAKVPKAAFQFRDLRAKALTDKSESSGVHEAQKQAGHRSVTTTEHYTDNLRGKKITPTR